MLRPVSTSIVVALTGFLATSPSQSAGLRRVVGLTVVIVRETEACRPSGYHIVDETDEPYDCPTIYYDPDVVRWTSSPGPWQDFKLWPGEKRTLEFDKPIAAILDALADEPYLDSAARRHSAVFVFDFHESMHAQVELERRSCEEGCVATSDWSDRHTLNGERRWITHTSACPLSPSCHVVWRLAVDDVEYLFETSFGH